MTKIRNSSCYNTDNNHKIEDEIYITPEDTLFQRTCRQINNAGKIFCNLVSQLWNKIVSFFSNELPSDREWKFMTVKVQRACSDSLRNLKRFSSDLSEKPGIFTQFNRSVSDTWRNIVRGIADRDTLS